jgi:flagellum-specific peptidoglycan hydrolase FlgJ
MPRRSADEHTGDRGRPVPRSTPRSASRPGADPDTSSDARADVRPDAGQAGEGAKPWLKATALVTVSASGVVSGLSLAPGTAAAMTSPANVPASLPTGLQSALQARLLADRTPAESAQSAQAETTVTAPPASAKPALDASIPGLATPTLAPTAKAPATAAPKEPAASRSSRSSRSSQSPKSSQSSGASKSPAPPETSSQQAFISSVAAGAIAAEQRYGVPASVTIAQAIDESDWGRSLLAARDNNLFGIKGTGPAGSVTYQTSEYENGSWVTIDAQFRAYHNVAESIDDHAALLATSGYYTRAMADRANPDAFANALTGVYATDPNYGATLIALMRTYDLYRYDTGSAASPAPAAPTRVHPHAAAGTAPPQAPAVPAAAPIAGSDVAPVLAPASQQPAAPRATAGLATAPIPGLLTPVTAVTAYYQPRLPEAVTAAFTETAKPAIAHLEPLYRDTAARAGISWKLLAACDWMQCQARPRHSPVHGEKLGTVNPDGSQYATKSHALAQCAADLTELASAVYGIDLTVQQPLSVRGLAEVFAAYRWGGILARHGVSAMEFPYSVAGLTAAHTGMRWPAVSGAPDRPGSKFRQPFGAVPVVLRIGYPATV